MLLAVGVMSPRAILAQSSQDATLQFEVASIKPRPPATAVARKRAPFQTTPGLLSMPDTTLKELVMFAYSVKSYELTGGPGWIDSARFDVEAKPPSPSTAEELQRMLRSLLADRFKLAFRKESRPTSIYALVVAKNGPRLRYDAPRGKAVGHAGTQAFVYYLNFLAPRPVIDKTGITSTSMFYLDTGKIEASVPGAAEVPPSRDDRFQATAGALEGQLGLKLVPTKVPMDVMVIDRAKRPSEN